MLISLLRFTGRRLRSLHAQPAAQPTSCKGSDNHRRPRVTRYRNQDEKIGRFKGFQSPILRPSHANDGPNQNANPAIGRYETAAKRNRRDGNECRHRVQVRRGRDVYPKTKCQRNRRHCDQDSGQRCARLFHLCSISNSIPGRSFAIAGTQDPLFGVVILRYEAMQLIVWPIDVEPTTFITLIHQSCWCIHDASHHHVCLLDRSPAATRSMSCSSSSSQTR
jgi:hypothetical protein